MASPSLAVCAFIVALLAASASASEIIIADPLGPGLFNPTHEKVIHAVSGNRQIEAGIQDGAAYLSIRDGVHKPVSVSLTETVAQIDSVTSGVQDKVVVMSLASSAVSEIIVIDARSGHILDDFFGYMPRVSPDGRWIAFREFYPPHFVDDVVDRYRLYDLSLDATSNRKKFSGPEEEEIGALVLPENKPCGNRSDGFFWSPDSRELVFACYMQDKSNNVQLESPLKLVQLQFNGRKFSTDIRPLTMEGCSASSECLNVLNGLKFEPQRLQLKFRMDLRSEKSMFVKR